MAAATLAAVVGASTAFAQQMTGTGQFPEFDAVDADLDGVVSSAEFRRALSEVENPDRLFNEADDNGNGQIDRQEWAAWRERRTVGTAAAQQQQPAAGPELPNQIEVSATDEILEGKYIRDSSLIGLPGNQISFGLLFSDDRDIILSSELMAPGLIEQWLPPFVSLSLGGKVYLGLIDDPDDDNLAFAPGVEARVDLPLDIPIAVVGRLFYAPEILVFGDADELVEFDARVEVRFLPQTTGFAGYRVLDFQREAGGEDKIVNGIHAGLRFAF